MDMGYRVGLAICGVAFSLILIMALWQDAEGQGEPYTFDFNLNFSERGHSPYTRYDESSLQSFYMIWNPENKTIEYGNYTFDQGNGSIGIRHVGHWDIIPDARHLSNYANISYVHAIPTVDGHELKQWDDLTPANIIMYEHLNTRITDLEAQVADLTYQVDKLRKLAKK